MWSVAVIPSPTQADRAAAEAEMRAETERRLAEAEARAETERRFLLYERGAASYSPIVLARGASLELGEHTRACDTRVHVQQLSLQLVQLFCHTSKHREGFAVF